MFKRSFRSHDPTRVDKAARLKKPGTMRDPQKVSKLQRSLTGDEFGRGGAAAGYGHGGPAASSGKNLAPSPIVTLTVGREGRLFAAHEDVLRQSPFFEAACRGQYLDAQSKRISLPDEEPEVFSAVLEYLYKGDYYPRLIHNKLRNSWELEDAGAPSRSPYPSPHPEDTPGLGGGGRAATSAVEATVYLSSVGQYLLRDTVVYCAADRYGLDELKRLVLRK